jgi:hypothetical protein
MKTTLFTSLLLCTVLSFTALAQTEKGTKLVGGTGSIGFHDPFSISLSPDVGIFLADNIALGASVQLSYSSGDHFTNSSLGLYPFFRYYFGGSETNKAFGQINAGFGHQWSKSTSSGFENKNSYNNTNVGIGVGMVHFITEQVGLEALLAYNHYSNNSGSNISSSSKGYLTLNVGFQIYLPAKGK